MFWTFNEGSGTIAHDLSPNQYNGSIGTGATWTPIGTSNVGTSTVSAAFNNTGTVQVQSGTLDFTGGVTNFAGTTLTGGTWSPRSTLQFTGASIQTDAANIILNGSASAIIDQSGNNALASLTSITSAGSLTIENGRNFTAASAFSNAGNLTVGASSTFSVTPTGIVAWYKADGNANDSAGGNNGTLEGGATYAAGHSGEAFSFNGTSAYVQAPASTLWGYGNNDFTINLWVNFNSVPSSTISNPSDVFIGEDQGGGNTAKWFFALGGGDLYFHINSPSIGPQFLAETPFSPTLGQWYNLAVTRSATPSRSTSTGRPSARSTAACPSPTRTSPSPSARRRGRGT